MYYYRQATTTVLDSYVFDCGQFNYKNDPLDHKDHHNFKKDGIYVQEHIPKIEYAIEASLKKRNGIQGLPLLIRISQSKYKNNYVLSKKTSLFDFGASMYKSMFEEKAGFIKGGVDYKDVEISLDQETWFPLASLNKKVFENLHSKFKTQLNALSESDYTKYYDKFCKGYFCDPNLAFFPFVNQNNGETYVIKFYEEDSSIKWRISCIKEDGKKIEGFLDELIKNNPEFIKLQDALKIDDQSQVEDCLIEILGYKKNKQTLDAKFDDLIINFLKEISNALVKESNKKSNIPFRRNLSPE